MHHQQLLFAGRAHHLDSGMVAVDENFPVRIEQENGVGAALEQLSEHAFSVARRGTVGTGPFVPVPADFTRAGALLKEAAGPLRGECLPVLCTVLLSRGNTDQRASWWCPDPVPA